jgi:hypothetical protein
MKKYEYKKPESVRWMEGERPQSRHKRAQEKWTKEDHLASKACSPALTVEETDYEAQRIEAKTELPGPRDRICGPRDMIHV